MLRAVRNNLRRIRYYSATPTQTRWTRAMDVALVVSLILAVPATLLADMMYVETTRAWELHGRLSRVDDDRLHAIVIDEDMVNRSWEQSRPYGTFLLYVPQLDAGFPFTSSRRDRPVAAELDLFTEMNLDTQTAMSPEHPVREAIEAALLRHGGEPAASWLGTRQRVERYWGPMGMNVLAWWFAIYVASSLGIVAVRGITALVEHRRLQRKQYWRNIGRCAACGYDMRGLEFASRCPECGELV